MANKFDIANFAGKTACVLGCGKSGTEVAKTLAGHGLRVLISESSARAALKYPFTFSHPLVEAEFGGHGGRVFECAFAVKSPGMFPKAPVLEKLRAAGVPVFSELEIALSFLPRCEVFAITGTNGKTTTTALLGEILAEAARLRGSGTAHVSGNIGIPLSALAAKVAENDYVVVEVSSYQLEDSAYFSPDAACLLNITPDHLDHHGGMENYIAAKRKVFAQQRQGAVCVFNALDENCRKLAAQAPAKALFFASSAASSLPAGPRLNAAYAAGKIRFELDGKTLEIVPPALPGLHNVENAMAAGLMALGRGIPAQAVERAFAAFRGVEHRIEDCGTINGLRCVNDSKSTNVDSTLVALKAFSGRKNVWLILGGLGKGAPYAPLAEHIRQSVKAILTIGQDAPAIARELDGAAPLLPCGTLDRALEECLARAEKGDVLLFSPACASFDQFRDFEQRGEYFKQIVARRLTNH